MRRFGIHWDGEKIEEVRAGLGQFGSLRADVQSGSKGNRKPWQRQSVFVLREYPVAKYMGVRHW